MNKETENRIAECGKVAYTTLAGLRNTYDMSRHCLDNDIEGDFVEMGVASGTQIGIMGITCQEQNKSRTIWGFDSFEGIPMACEKDTVQPAIPDAILPTEEVKDKSTLLVSSGITVHSQESVEANLSRWAVSDLPYQLVKGWFQNTLPDWSKKIDKICLLRLDGDLYDSTIVSLKYLYPKISKGGVVIVDDYALEGVQVALDEYFEGEVPELLDMELNDPLENYGAKYFYKP